MGTSFWIWFWVVIIIAVILIAGFIGYTIWYIKWLREKDIKKQSKAILPALIYTTLLTCFAGSSAAICLIDSASDEDLDTVGKKTGGSSFDHTDQLNDQQLLQQLNYQQSIQQQINDQQLLQQLENQRQMDHFMEEGRKSVTPFEMGGYDMNMGNSFNDFQNFGGGGFGF